LDDVERSALRELARVTTDVGVALFPAGHDELLHSIISTARTLFDAEACSIALLDEDQDELIFHVASGGAERAIVGMRVPVGTGIAGWVVASGQPIAIQDVADDPRFARGVAESTGYMPSSILATPLETERDVIGVIEILDLRRGGLQSPKDLDLLALFAHQAALALESARVFSELGRALFAAAAHMAEGEDVVAALERVAGEAHPSGGPAEVAARFAELARLGPKECAAASKLLGAFLTYVRTRDGR
jgi:GAF domain-containing protein